MWPSKVSSARTHLGDVEVLRLIRKPLVELLDALSVSLLKFLLDSLLHPLHLNFFESPFGSCHGGLIDPFTTT